MKPMVYLAAGCPFVAARAIDGQSERQPSARPDAATPLRP